ncbi:MAG: hypothetical protein Tsb0017_26970 [Geothermobacteraceae bacterium]
MNIADFDFDRCRRPEKEVCEGLCLSFDLMRGLCMETAEVCDALLPCGGSASQGGPAITDDP